MSTTTARDSGALSTGNGILLVAEREIGSKLRSKAFLISTGILLLIALAGVLIGGFMSKNTSETKIAVTAETAQAVHGLPGLKAIEAADATAAEKLVRDGSVEAALIPAPGDAAFGFEIVALKDAPNGLQGLFAKTPKVTILEPDTTNPLLRYLVAIGFGVVFLMAASTFGATMAQSVVEEKSTRVVELLLAAIPARVLLAGKVLGNTVLAMAQILALAAIAVVGLIVTGQNAVLEGLGSPLVWFAVFFLFGFVLLASLFAAAAALVSRQEDIGSTTMPITMLVMAPYILVIIFNDNPLVMTILSYIPFSAPVAMPVRLFVGEAQWWEPLVSLVILLAACVAAILVAAKIYENSLLRMGARVKLSEALKG
ncbi:ABC transporter permease [Microbacterium azadirachtae]|uniref:ABC transporter permease n=1 Tax=Microbacterium azadirachtae TaxID=582680 RepID=UPI00088E9FF9|nr:ABC transporter permease [Microbacterium azadirachtae]SDL76489.1 ABC-2 type transport system permease protein [Microbacterium azadirachtae]SEG05701.1 ABC-2 type transport system permease protein [Microbacterium azadirachtae]SEG08287.1 ABC-2 type transport system permease protein [Microbacterium azadirachtae]